MNVEVSREIHSCQNMEVKIPVPSSPLLPMVSTLISDISQSLIELARVCSLSRRLELARVGQSRLKLAGADWSQLDSVRVPSVDQSWLVFTGLCWSWLKLAEVGQSCIEYARVCLSLLEFAGVSQNRLEPPTAGQSQLKLATVGYSQLKESEVIQSSKPAK